LRVYPDGRFALSIDTKANAATVASTVAHEFGHALQFHLFNKAPQAVQDRVRGEWRDLVQKYRTDDSLTAEDFIRDFGSVGKFLDQKSAPSTLKRMTAKEYMQRLTDAAFA